MLNQEHRTIDEAYTSATASSDLRCDTRDGAPRSDTDLLIAAGWSPSRVGAALMRLHTEWDGAGRLRPAVAADFVQQAKQRPADSKLPQQTPAAARARAEELARLHNIQQTKLLMAHLKSLPGVREQLTLQLQHWRVADAAECAATVLHWWLCPNCQACHGRKFEVVPDTGRLSDKACKHCSATGLAKLPRGQDGRKLANWMDDCVQIARRSIRGRLHATTGRG